MWLAIYCLPHTTYRKYVTHFNCYLHFYYQILQWFKLLCIQLLCFASVRMATWSAETCGKSLRSRLRLKCDGTRAETRFRLSTKRTSPFKSSGLQFSRLLAAEMCASAVLILDTPCSEVVWRVLATHSIRQFPLHFPSRASPCAITFQLDSTLFNTLVFILLVLYIID
jgi:hypothetical protein